MPCVHSYGQLSLVQLDAVYLRGMRRSIKTAACKEIEAAGGLRREGHMRKNMFTFTRGSSRVGRAPRQQGARPDSKRR